MLYYHMKEPAVRVLGPGLRYCLWVQGCARRCPGCVAQEAWDMRAGKPIEEEALSWEIALSGAEGLTVSGGEPFLQAEALARLIRSVRQKKDMDVIVYTGNTYEALAADPAAAPLLRQTDLLIDGEYIRELDDGKGLRGSSNQRAIPLNARGEALLALWARQARCREVFRHGAEVHEVGLPGDAHSQTES